MLEGGPLTPVEVLSVLRPLLERVGSASGLDFSVVEPRIDAYRDRSAARGRIYYIGPRRAREATRVNLDLDGEERVVTRPEARPVVHDYAEQLPPPATVLCYSLVEVFAEKIRAMAERGRPRDLFDIITLFRRPDIRPGAAAVRSVLAEKCARKGVPIPNLESLGTAETLAELKSEWKNMLERQLAEIPALPDMWSHLGDFFAWLEESDSMPP